MHMYRSPQPATGPCLCERGNQHRPGWSSKDFANSVLLTLRRISYDFTQLYFPQGRRKEVRYTPISLSFSVSDSVSKVFNSQKPASANSMPMRLKSKCQQGCIPSGKYRGESVHSFQLLVTMATSLQTFSMVTLPCQISCLLLRMGVIAFKALPENSVQSPILRFLIHLQCPLLPYKVVHIPGIRTQIYFGSHYSAYHNDSVYIK